MVPTSQRRNSPERITRKTRLQWSRDAPAWPPPSAGVPGRNPLPPSHMVLFLPALTQNSHCLRSAETGNPLEPGVRCASGNVCDRYHLVTWKKPKMTTPAPRLKEVAVTMVGFLGNRPTERN